jgi:glutamate-5-semialdehyde dehydrogenase
MADRNSQVPICPIPWGKSSATWTRPNGLNIQKVRVPIGVIGIIYESRPNVTAMPPCSAPRLAMRRFCAGAVRALRATSAIRRGAGARRRKAGLPQDAIQLIPVTDREAVRVMCEMDQYMDCIVPRGGKGLIETVVRHARMPVIKHYDGICIMYIDAEADQEMAKAIVLNAKVQRPGVCNAIETVLVHAKARSNSLPRRARCWRKACSYGATSARSRALADE